MFWMYYVNHKYIILVFVYFVVAIDNYIFTQFLIWWPSPGLHVTLSIAKQSKNSSIMKIVKQSFFGVFFSELTKVFEAYAHFTADLPI